MGLDCAAVKFLCGAKSLGVDFARTIMVGRQGFYPNYDTLERTSAVLGISRHAIAMLESSQFGEPFFTLLVLSVAAEMIWTTLFTPLAAINRHIIVSYSFAFLSIAGIGACYFLASAYGLIGIGIALLVINLVMVVISSKEVISRKPSSVDEMFLDKH